MSFETHTSTLQIRIYTDAAYATGYGFSVAANEVLQITAASAIELKGFR